MLKLKLREKKKAIKRALSPPDVKELRKLSISYGGLINSDLRSKVWPHLLGVADVKFEIDQEFEHSEHESHGQVKLDVDRCLGSFPDWIEKSQRPHMQDELLKMIVEVLGRQPVLNYYQGYHDVAITFLFVCGREQGLPALERLSTHHLRDFMDPTMDKTSHILNYLRPILERLNPALVDFIVAAEVEMSFAISWLITWYSHVLRDQDKIQRLYDFFLACHPLMPIYFAAHIVSANADKIMAVECEMPYVYQKLLHSALDPNLPLEELISKSSSFYIQFPPSCFAERASEYYKENLAVSTFADYALTALQENPDEVLKRLNLSDEPQELQARPVLPFRIPKHVDWNKLKRFGFMLGGTAGALAIAASGVFFENAPSILNFFLNFL